MTKTTLNFASMAEARAHFLKKGYYTVDEGTDSYIMHNYANGSKVAEAIINREGFLCVVAEVLEW